MTFPQYGVTEIVHATAASMPSQLATEKKTCRTQRRSHQKCYAIEDLTEQMNTATTRAETATSITGPSRVYMLPNTRVQWSFGDEQTVSVLMLGESHDAAPAGWRCHMVTKSINILQLLQHAAHMAKEASNYLDVYVEFRRVEHKEALAKSRLSFGQLQALENTGTVDSADTRQAYITQSALMALVKELAGCSCMYRDRHTSRQPCALGCEKVRLHEVDMRPVGATLQYEKLSKLTIGVETAAKLRKWMIGFGENDHKVKKMVTRLGMSATWWNKYYATFQKTRALIRQHEAHAHMWSLDVSRIDDIRDAAIYANQRLHSNFFNLSYIQMDYYLLLRVLLPLSRKSIAKCDGTVQPRFVVLVCGEAHCVTLFDALNYLSRWSLKKIQVARTFASNKRVRLGDTKHVMASRKYDTVADLMCAFYNRKVNPDVGHTLAWSRKKNHL